MELNTDNGRTINLNLDNMTGSVTFDLGGCSSVFKEVRQIEAWMEGDNDMIGEDLEIAIGVEGYAIDYKSEMTMDDSDFPYIEVTFNIKPE